MLAAFKAEDLSRLPGFQHPRSVLGLKPAQPKVIKAKQIIFVIYTMFPLTNSVTAMQQSARHGRLQGRRSSRRNNRRSQSRERPGPRARGEPWWRVFG